MLAIVAAAGVAAASSSCGKHTSSDAQDKGPRVGWLDVDRSWELDPTWNVSPAPPPISFAKARDAIWPRRPAPWSAPVSATLASTVRGGLDDGLPDPGDAEWRAVEVATTAWATHEHVARPVHAFIARRAPIPVALTWDGVLRRADRSTGSANLAVDAASFEPDPGGGFGCFLPRVGCGSAPIVYLGWAGAERSVERLYRALDKEQAQLDAMGGAPHVPYRPTPEAIRERAANDWLLAETFEAYDAFLRGDDAWTIATGRMVLARRAETNGGGDWALSVPLRVVVADAWRRERTRERALGGTAILRLIEDVSKVKHDGACRLDFGDDPIFRALVAEGLTLLPSLLAVLEHDHRLTRALAENHPNCRTTHARTAHVALAALEAFLQTKGGAPTPEAPAAEAPRIRLALASSGLSVP